MFTCCPHCHTCFRITRPQLDVAQGHVRCGTCSRVFNAKQHLHEEMPGKAEKKPEPKKSARTSEKKKPAAAPAKKTTPVTKQKASAHKKPAAKKPAAPAKKTVKEKKAITPTPAPPPDIDLFDYASISHNQDVPGVSAKKEFEEQNIDDIFDDLESQHSLRQPDFSKLKKAKTHRNKKEPLLPDPDEEVEDTALIDISAMEDDWLTDLTGETVSQDDTDESLLSADEITEPLAEERIVNDTISEAESRIEPEPPQQKKKTTTTDKEATSRYEYVDPSELLKEEKGIVEILEDMDAQLNLEMDTSEYDNFDESQNSMIDPHFIRSNKHKTETKNKTEESPVSHQEPLQKPVTDESDISGMFRHAIQDAGVNPATPSPGNKDDFESEFLAGLDSTILSPDGDEQDTSKTSPAEKTKRVEEPAKKTEPALSIAEDEFDLNRPSKFPDLPGMEEDIPYQLRDNFADETSSRSTQVWALYLGAVIVLIISALLQLVIFRSTDLADNFPSLEPTLVQLCKNLPCRYTGPQDISQIKLLSRDIRLHPKEEKALLITATMVNRAPFRQPYPNIEITLSDLSGDVVARRRFSPEEYLNRIYTPLLRMPAGQPVQIALEVIDPGRDAVNFEFTFH